MAHFNQTRTQVRANTIFITLAILSGGTLLISNLLATKLWDFFGIAVDGGIVLFPLSYILNDLIVGLYGKRSAHSVILASAALNAFAVVFFTIVGRLPAYPGWNNQAAYDAILGFAPRIVAGSLLAFVISGLIDNVIFVKIKGGFIARALGSSAVSRLIDTAIFETVAFLGILSFPEFLGQAAFAYTAGMVIEVLVSPLTAIIARSLHHKIAFPEADDADPT